ncbi:ABC transporter substrate-binding protein [Roseococcus sp. SYP-B2431]|uniref:MlaC/ttg2D family ABC transporter substrate-binding protein n=1 Tax=Roseococcus sp. SYP-B2431 TaxID=2496640 RepID=UPI00103C2C8F|nr:ABC transporter substrate-binding protein [Roseococcus sp. SYP-B2431]TCH98574.1 ABC transporter substrate-binding protein [Roseococcus sp. SYP-B2431]
MTETVSRPDARPTRRALLALLAGLPFLRPLAASAQMDPGRATAFIQQTGEALVGALNNTGLSAAQRRERVAGILRQAVDMEGTGRFILGRWWRTASPAEQQEYQRLFEQTLILNLAARFGEYQGVRFALGRSQQRTEDDALVTTVVERPSSAPVNLDWRVADVGGQPRIVDLVAEGTSLRLTQRSEYSAVIQRGGNQVSALLAAMRNQLQQLQQRG